MTKKLGEKILVKKLGVKKFGSKKKINQKYGKEIDILCQQIFTQKFSVKRCKKMFVHKNLAATGICILKFVNKVFLFWWEKILRPKHFELKYVVQKNWFRKIVGKKYYFKKHFCSKTRLISIISKPKTFFSRFFVAFMLKLSKIISGR